MGYPNSNTRKCTTDATAAATSSTCSKRQPGSSPSVTPASLTERQSTSRSAIWSGVDDEFYETYRRCQICCVYTGLREYENRYCEDCIDSLNLVPIPISEWYEKDNSLIDLDDNPRFPGRPTMGFG